MDALIYLDEGVDPQTYKSLRRAFRGRARSLSGQEVCSTPWEGEAPLFVMPGGRDVPYHNTLQGEGNRRLLKFVQEGGTYLGICAGAYYGTGFVEFERGGPLEVCASRELAFFPGKGVGPAYGHGAFDYESEAGARLAHIRWHDGTLYPAYYNGGCHFQGDHPNVEVLACYDDIEGQPPAIIRCQVGKGQAVLSGVHPEHPTESLGGNDLERQKLWERILTIV